MVEKFVDRQSTYPNRYKITKADGFTEYVTLERADEPVVVGTPLNAETFNSMLRRSCPVNLLDNSDFRNPVNQRGAEYYTANGYTIDRWILWDGMVAISKDGYVSVRGTMYQLIYGLDLEKTYTIAAKNGDGILVVSGIFTVGASKSLGNLTLGMTVLNGYAEVVLSNTPGYDTGGAIWVALYEGKYTADNLPVYQSKGYTQELLACQRELPVLTSDQYGDTLPTPGTPGRIFFKKVSG